LWGEPVIHDSGLGKPYDAFVPFATHQSNDEPIDKEIIKQGFHFSLPATKVNFGGALVDLAQRPEAYSRYVQLAGNELKSPAWGVGAKDMLNQVVSGTHPLSSVYNMLSDGPAGGKEHFIRNQIDTYRDQARQQLLKEYPDIAQQVSDKQQAAQAPMATQNPPLVATSNSST